VKRSEEHIGHEYKTQEIADMLGITMNMLQSYVNFGYASPSIQESDGHGTTRIWDWADVLRLAAGHTLREMGLKSRQVTKILDMNNDYIFTDGKGYINVIDKAPAITMLFSAPALRSKMIYAFRTKRKSSQPFFADEIMS